MHPWAGIAHARRVRAVSTVLMAAAAFVGLGGQAVRGLAPITARADSTFDQDLFSLINQDRANAGVAPLEWHPTLAAIAESKPYGGCGFTISGRAQDMIQRNYFSHTICGSQNVFNIMQADGLQYGWAGENIGWESGYTDPMQAATYLNTSYMNSSGHRANILNPNFTSVGVGSAIAAPGQTWSGGGSPMTNVYMSVEDFASVSTPPPPVYAGTHLASSFTGGTVNGIASVSQSQTSVITSDGSSFQSASTWSTTPFYGSRTTVAGDLTGGGRSDLVAVNDGSTWVMRSTGSGFLAPEPWSSIPFYGNRGTFAADLTGDGRADLVAVNDGSTWVMRNTGSGFAAPELWSASPFYGSVATLTGDIDGDHRADLIAVNASGTWVMRNTGSGFATPELWSASPFYGSQATLTADLNGDGRADLVAVNRDSTWVMTSTGSGFTAPARWA